MSSTNEPVVGLSDSDRELLLSTAERSIVHGLQAGWPLEVDASQYPASVTRPAASFVTLRHGERLRGCMGSVAPVDPLVVDVARNAYKAAFEDPRFSPLQPDELDGLTLEVSVLSPMSEMRFADEEDLLAQVRPGVDGLMLVYGPFRGLFLPKVWDQLPDKRQFLEHLKAKAGLSPDFWAKGVRVLRFTTETFGRTVQARPDQLHP